MSRATMVDSQPEEETVEDTEENEAQGIQQEDFVEQPQKEPTVPEKYQGKSLEQVVQMHQEAEKLLGRQSSEVGELRKVVDDYISSQPQQPAPQQYVEPEDDIDYFTDLLRSEKRRSTLLTTKNNHLWQRLITSIQTCRVSLRTLSLLSGLKLQRLGLSCS
jgi:hypothetical protein